MLSMVKRNIVANLFGNAGPGIVALVFAPVYIAFLGIEAFGLIGLFTTLLGIFAFLDMGLGSTLNREIARVSVNHNAATETHDLIRTMELPYIGMGFLIGVGVIILSPILATQWIQPEHLSQDSVQRSLALMGICLALQWPISIYTGGLMGAQRQVIFNVLNVSFSVLRGLGAVLVLSLISRSVEAFFLWQCLISGLHVASMRYALLRSIQPPIRRPRFQIELLRRCWRFAAGVTGITVTATVFLHADNILLSRLLSLEAFGYYSLAKAASVSLSRVVAPVFQSLYPRFSQYVRMGAEENIKLAFHKGAQLISVFVWPVVGVMTFFANEVLYLWTRDVGVASRTSVLLVLLMWAKAINAMINMPYAIQLAYGKTSWTFAVNTGGLVLLVPGLLVCAYQWGAVGAASVLLGVNVGCMIATGAWTIKKLLHGSVWAWLWHDCLQLMFVACIVSMAVFMIFRESWPVYVKVSVLGMAWSVSILLAAFWARSLALWDRLWKTGKVLWKRKHNDHK